jgi:Flp pilus assembly protein TadD
VAFERALASSGQLVEPLTALVVLDLAEQKGTSARARVEQRLQKTPDSSAVLALAGRTWAATGDMAKGEEFLRRAIGADASNFDAYSDLARLYLAQKKLDTAVAAFDAASAKRPRDAGPATMAAVIVHGQGKEAEAVRRYERIVELNPEAAVAANNLAYFYASRGEQLDRALQLAQAAKAAASDQPNVNDTLGFVYLKKDLPSLAIPPLKLAIDKDPNNPVFHYHLGLAYSRTGDSAAARQTLERALKLQGDFAGADDAKKVLQALN